MVTVYLGNWLYTYMRDNCEVDTVQTLMDAVSAILQVQIETTATGGKENCS